MLPSWLRAPRLTRPPRRSSPSRSSSARRSSSSTAPSATSIAAAREAAPGGDVHDLDASELGPGELESLTSPSLFGGGCVLVVRSAQNAAKEVAAELARYARNPGARRGARADPRGRGEGQGAAGRGQGRRSPGDRVPEGHQVRRAARLHQGGVPPRGPASRRRRGAGAARRGGFGPAGARGRLRPARRRHRRRHRRGRSWPGTTGAGPRRPGSPSPTGRSRGTSRRRSSSCAGRWPRACPRC